MKISSQSRIIVIDDDYETEAKLYRDGIRQTQFSNELI
jgi:hypothetical protein